MKTIALAELDWNGLASLWCQWNGQRGTEKQIAKVQRILTADNLRRMLAERGVLGAQVAA